MIVNTTYTNKETEKSIDLYIGKQFSWRQRIMLKGIGSKRMIIREISPKMLQCLQTTADLNYGSIELRPKGIVVHIHKKLTSYSWAIPYYKLHIYNTSFFSIHAEGNFVRFEKNKLYAENKSFIQKLKTQKNTVLNTTEYYAE